MQAASQVCNAFHSSWRDGLRSRPMPLPSKRDYADVRRRLTAWLATRLPAGADPQVGELSVPEGTGMSSETLLFDATWTEDGEPHAERFVARMSPEMGDYPVFPSYDLELQAPLPAARRGAHSDVPVPEAPWLELDETPARLAVLRHGAHRRRRAARHAALRVRRLAGSRRSPADRARLQRNAHRRARPLARHRRDRSGRRVPRSARVGRVAAATNTSPTSAGTTTGRARASTTRSSSGASRGSTSTGRPTKARSCSTGATAASATCMWRDFEPVAVLDWEMASLGAPEVDLAWMIFLHRFFQDMAETLRHARHARLHAAATTSSRDYEELSGRKVHDLEFYEMFAALAVRDRVGAHEHAGDRVRRHAAARRR